MTMNWKTILIIAAIVLTVSAAAVVCVRYQPVWVTIEAVVMLAAGFAYGLLFERHRNKK